MATYIGHNNMTIASWNSTGGLFSSQNVTSVTKPGTGNYQVNFINSIENYWGASMLGYVQNNSGTYVNSFEIITLTNTYASLITYTYTSATARTARDCSTLDYLMRC